LTRGTRDGIENEVFTSKCCEKGSLLILIKANNRVFGGYSFLSWPSLEVETREDDKAFIFSLDHKSKHEPYQNKKYCLWNNSVRYLMFGGKFADICIINSSS
jgi:hypothetical protein